MAILEASVPVFRFFEEISAIPRPSGGEAAIGEYLQAFAARRGLDCLRDGAGNVLIRCPGSPGRESEPPLLLQSHTDMVCLSAPAPLKLRVEDGWVTAEDSTLGADDGAGVALTLALLEDPALSHPPLECLFTAGEEAGMTGALRLRKDAVTARRMVNLDGTGETVTAVSCSGGKRILAHCPVAYAECALPCFLLRLEGGLGGHSGAEIRQNRSNALQLGFRLLYRLLERGADIRIAAIGGGSRENAIPTDFRVLFASAAPERLLRTVTQQFEGEVRELYPDEPGLRLTLETAEKAGSALTPEDSGALISMGYLLPTGLVALSPALDIPLVSLNLGVLRQEQGEVLFSYNIRSPLQSQRDELARQIEAVSSIFGGYITLTAEYPGWSYSPVSPLREALGRVLGERGETLREEALHVGLETGIFSSRYPGMDIVTYGPVILDCHTPRERMELESLRRSYEVLALLLASV